MLGDKVGEESGKTIGSIKGLSPVNGRPVLEPPSRGRGPGRGSDANATAPTIPPSHSVHHGVFAHSALDTVPVLGRLLRRTVPHGGDWSTVDVGPVYAPKPLEQHSLPGYRQIVDLSSTNDNRFLDAVGQSGHMLSPRYDDALPLWKVGKHRRMRTDRADVERDAIGHLRLLPK